MFQTSAAYHRRLVHAGPPCPGGSTTHQTSPVNSSFTEVAGETTTVSPTSLTVKWPAAQVRMQLHPGKLKYQELKPQLKTIKVGCEIIYLLMKRT
jgi:hypothetical protein